MEDENKVKKIIKIVIITIIVLIVILIGFFIYRNIQIKTNTNKLYEYVKKEGYQKNENNYYTKDIKTENQTITEIIGAKEYPFAQKTITSTNDKYINIFLTYESNNTVTIKYKSEEYNEENKIVTINQQGTLKNNNFKCEVISNNDLNTRCNTMKKEVEKYYQKINNILKENKINLKYVKTNAKKQTRF